jgi:hypothetical protein
MLGGFLHICTCTCTIYCGLWPPDNTSCIFLTWYQSYSFFFERATRAVSDPISPAFAAVGPPVAAVGLFFSTDCVGLPWWPPVHRLSPPAALRFGSASVQSRPVPPAAVSASRNWSCPESARSRSPVSRPVAASLVQQPRESAAVAACRGLLLRSACEESAAPCI